MGSAIVVGNQSEDALAYVHDRGPTGVSEQAANQEREPDLNVVQKGGCAGRVDEANAMGRVREQGGSRLHRGQMAAFANSRLDPPACHTPGPLGRPAFRTDAC
jgi:hypothetical protein